MNGDITFKDNGDTIDVILDDYGDDLTVARVLIDNKVVHFYLTMIKYEVIYQINRYVRNLTMFSFTRTVSNFSVDKIFEFADSCYTDLAFISMVHTKDRSRSSHDLVKQEFIAYKKNNDQTCKIIM